MASKATIIVSPRGQITLPSDIRKRLGIKEGSVVTVEERSGELVLRPAAVLEIDIYSDDSITKWDAEDKLDNPTKERLKKKLGK